MLDRQSGKDRAGGQPYKGPFGVPAYQGGFTAPLDSLYGQARSLAQSLFGGSAQQLRGQTNSALSNVLSGRPSYQVDPQTTANYFQQAVVNPALRTYDRDIKPRINEAFNTAGNGVFSSRQSEAQGQYLSDMQTGFGQQLATLQQQNQGLQAQLNEGAATRQLQGIGQASQYGNQPLIQAGLLEQLGSPFQNQAQLGINAQFQEWLRTQPYNNPYLQLGLQASSVNAVSPYLQSSPWNSVLNAGLGFAGGSALAGSGAFGAGAQSNPFGTAGGLSLLQLAGGI